jgi:hypothetical protein
VSSGYTNNRAGQKRKEGEPFCFSALSQALHLLVLDSHLCLSAVMSPVCCSWMGFVLSVGYRFACQLLKEAWQDDVLEVELSASPWAWSGPVARIVQTTFQ